MVVLQGSFDFLPDWALNLEPLLVNCPHQVQRGRLASLWPEQHAAIERQEAHIAVRKVNHLFAIFNYELLKVWESPIDALYVYVSKNEIGNEN